MQDIQIGIFSNDEIENEIISRSFIPNNEFNTIEDIKDIKDNLNICIYIIDSDTFSFEELSLIPSVVEDNKELDFIFCINPLINKNTSDKRLYEENIKIRKNTIEFLNNHSKKFFVVNNEDLVVDELHSVYRSFKIGRLIGYNNSHSLS